jgi:hypothetical protein
MSAATADASGLAHGNNQVVRNPYTSPLISLFFLTTLSLSLPAVGLFMVFYAGWEWWTLLPACLPFLLLVLAQAITWTSGMLEARKAENFLASSRPILRWTYSPAELKQIADAKWEDEKDDWKLQLFGLTFIFWLVGSLVGILGILDGSGDINPLAATAGGFIFGLALGIPIAAGSHLALRWEYMHTNPHAAIGTDELFYNSQYFKADGKGSFIHKAAVVKEGETAKIVIETASKQSFGKSHGGQEWEIPIPEAMAGDAEAILLPRIKIIKREEDMMEEVGEAAEETGKTESNLSD